MSSQNIITPTFMVQPGGSHHHQLSSNSILHDRHVHNTLRPVPLDAAGLQLVLTELQSAIVRGVQEIREHTANEQTDSDRRDSIYVGHTGIALTLLRIFAQSKSIGFTSPSQLLARLSSAPNQNSRSHIPSSTQPVDLIRSYLPTIRPHHPRVNRLSPLDSPIGPAFVYILSCVVFPNGEWAGAGDMGVPGVDVRGAGYHYGVGDRRASYAIGEVASGLYAQDSPVDPQWDAAITTLRRAVNMALKDSTPGNDEILYGRAGLLAALLNLRVWLGLDNGGVTVALSPQQREHLFEVANDDIIGGVIDKIVEAGDEGRRTYEETTNEKGLPLMWAWHGKWYLGAIHGATGILTVLLQSPRDIISPYLSLFTSCISSLCALTIAYNGHLPAALPANLKLSRYDKYDMSEYSFKQDEKPARLNLVQLCHGSPGLLLLLATMRTKFPADFERMKRKARAQSKAKHSTHGKHHADTSTGRRRSLSNISAPICDWTEAERLASDRVWEEGLLRKGLSLCHGVSGNGWVGLLSSLSGGLDADANADTSLSRSLAFLLHSVNLPPMPPLNASLHKFDMYRIPDHPYSLFEGLAGAICAWGDACTVVKERLETLEEKWGPRIVDDRKVSLEGGIDEYDSPRQSEDDGWGKPGTVGGGERGKLSTSRSKGKQRTSRDQALDRVRPERRSEETEQRQSEEYTSERQKERGRALVFGIPGLGGARIRGIL